MFSGKKVLIIDSNANYLYALEAKFALYGAEVLTHHGAGEIEDLSRIIRDSGVAGVILELELTDLNAFDVIEVIRNDSGSAAVPVFIYTESGDDSARRRVANFNKLYYFNKKEVDHEELLNKIHKILINQEKLKSLKTK